MEALKTLRSLLHRDEFMVKIDLADAFHTVHNQPYFRFQWDKTVQQGVR